MSKRWRPPVSTRSDASTTPSASPFASSAANQRAFVLE